MEAISLKLEDSFAKAIERSMKKNNYTTKSEFIRDALRDKLDQLETKERLQFAEKVLGSAPRTVSDAQIRKAREAIGAEFFRRYGLD